MRVVLAGLLAMSCDSNVAVETMDARVLPDAETPSDRTIAVDVSIRPPGHPFAAGTQPGSPWPMLGGTTGRIGRSPANGPVNANLRWKHSIGSPAGSASPVIAADGTVYLGSQAGKLFAIDATGVERWTLDVQSRMNGAAVIGRDGTIFIGANDALMRAISPDGTILRSVLTKGSISFSPVIDDDQIVYFFGDDVGAYGWSATSLFDLDAGCVGELSISFGRLYEDCGYYPSSPPERDSFAFHQEWFGGIFEVDGRSFHLTSGAGTFTAYDASDVKLWSVRMPVLDAGEYWIHRPSWAAAEDGSLRVTQDNRVYSVDPNGIRWMITLDCPCITTRPLVDAVGTTYFGAEDGIVRAVDANGQLLWSLSTGGPVRSSPAMAADGTLYIGSNDGNLYAVAP